MLEKRYRLKGSFRFQEITGTTRASCTWCLPIVKDKPLRPIMWQLQHCAATVPTVHLIFFYLQVQPSWIHSIDAFFMTIHSWWLWYVWINTTKKNWVLAYWWQTRKAQQVHWSILANLYVLFKWQRTIWTQQPISTDANSFRKHHLQDTDHDNHNNLSQLGDFLGGMKNFSVWKLQAFANSFF